MSEADKYYSKVSLAGIGNGALEEQFQIELEKVLLNIRDVNTDAEAPREITIKIKMMADKDRSLVKYLTDVKSTKIEQVHKHVGFFQVGKDSGQLVAKENRLTQADLFNQKSIGSVSNG